MSHGSGGQPKRGWYISGSLTLTMNGLTISGYSINSCNCLYQGAGVYITLSSGQVTMNSVTVKSGSTHAFAGCVGPQYSRAAGIYLYQGTLVMSDAIVKDFNAVGYGGGIYVRTGSFTMTGGSFSNNQAHTNGGAIYIEGGDVSLIGVAFSDNRNVDPSLCSQVPGADVYIASGASFSSTSSCPAGQYGAPGAQL